MYVCLCSGVTDADIQTAIDGGASTLEAVVLATRAGSRCGTCRTEVAEMIAAAAEGRAVVHGTRACCREDGKRHLDIHDDVRAA
jgi:bacterioferritin-associated ferredoxin